MKKESKPQKRAECEGVSLVVGWKKNRTGLQELEIGAWATWLKVC